MVRKRRYYYDGRSGWRKVRKQIGDCWSVTVLAKLWVRSKRLRDFNAWYLRRKALPPSRKYRPLQGRMIRLLRIQLGHAMSTIKCDFSYVSLDSPGDYAALSYTWGQTAPSVPILVNGYVTLVSENLYLALLHLRKSDVETVWIDAICINQDDIAERARQVSYMKDIYQKADLVLVWLGESNKLSERAFDELYGLTRMIGMDQTVPSHVFDRNRMDRDPDRWRAISEVLLRPWFRRVWIIQEALSARRATIICGEDDLELKLFLKLINSMVRAGALRRIMSYHPNQHEFSERMMQTAVNQLEFLVEAKIERITLLLGHRFRPTLLNYLAGTRWAEATDPRDKVYGILSLADDSPSLGHYYTEKGKRMEWIPYKPDYTLSKAEVFINTTKAILCTTKSLEVLQFAKYTFNRSNGLPSWVPDWSSEEPHVVPDYQSLCPKDDDKKQHWPSDWRLSATRQEKPLSHSAITRYCAPSFFLGKRNTLTVTGFQFDIISAVSQHINPQINLPHSVDPHRENKADFLDIMQQWLEIEYRWVEECIQLATQCCPYPTGENTWTSLWKTLNESSAEDEIPILDNGEILLENIRKLQSMIPSIKELEKFEASIPPCPLLEIGMEALASNFEHSISLIPKTNTDNLLQRFAVTRNKLMGLVPDGTKAGDVICVIYGCETPLILRSCERNRYKFVGHYKMQGFNFDEAVVESRVVHQRRGKQVSDYHFSVFDEAWRNVYITLKKTRRFTLV